VVSAMCIVDIMPIFEFFDVVKSHAVLLTVPVLSIVNLFPDKQEYASIMLFDNDVSS